MVKWYKRDGDKKKCPARNKIWARYLATSSWQDLPAPQLPDDIGANFPALQRPDAVQNEIVDGDIDADLPALQLPNAMQNERAGGGIEADLPALQLPATM